MGPKELREGKKIFTSRNKNLLRDAEVAERREETEIPQMLDSPHLPGVLMGEYLLRKLSLVEEVQHRCWPRILES